MSGFSLGARYFHMILQMVPHCARNWSGFPAAWTMTRCVVIFIGKLAASGRGMREYRNDLPPQKHNIAPNILSAPTTMSYKLLPFIYWLSTMKMTFLPFYLVRLLPLFFSRSSTHEEHWNIFFIMLLFLCSFSTLATLEQGKPNTRTIWNIDQLFVIIYWVWREEKEQKSSIPSADKCLS